MNSFNQPLQQFPSIGQCPNAFGVTTTSGGGLYGASTGPQPAANISSTLTNTSLVAMQQFSNAQSAGANFVTFQPNYAQTISCLQKEVESLKKANSDLQVEMEKLHSEFNYQVMSDNVKLNEQQKQLEQLHREKLEQEKAYKELKVKYDEKYALFRSPHQSEERSFLCDECYFDVKSQVALFIHKLNHHFESSIPRHLQLSTRSFSTMPDDSIRFKYKCHCCEIDSAREFARHEIYVHIYQFHTFDVPFKCKFCFLYFTSKSYLNDHLVEKHSVPSRLGKGKRKANGLPANGADLKSGCLSADQLNSTLPLSQRAATDGLVFSVGGGTKKANKTTSNHHPNLSDDTTDINELFNQLVGETIDPDQPIGTEPATASKETNSSNSNRIPRSNSTGSSAAAATAATPTAQTESLQQIMSDLEGDDSLNCKYPGCKFLATTKNHLKFHISAHLMSKYKCPYCTFVGNRVVEIKKHTRSKHTDQHVYLCPDCDFASDCDKNFVSHFSKNHNSQVDVSVVIEQMFLNESNKVGQNMLKGST